MTERDYAIRSFKEVTLNAARHTEERMNLYYGKNQGTDEQLSGLDFGKSDGFG